jgi:hypothetical protein
MSMSKYQKAFLIWLGLMVPLVIGLTIIGITCESCLMPCGANIQPGEVVVCVPGRADYIP